MNADEIVATIRKLMPCINDCMDLYEYERKALTKAADLITSQQAEIDRLKCELNSVNAIFAGANKTLEEYAQSARVVALYLEKFCDRSLPYDEMIADAARKANAEIDRLTTENEQLAIHGGKYMKIAEYRYELFAKCADELEQAELRNNRLTALNKDMVELLGLAVEDINRMKLTTQCVNYLLCLSKAKSMKQAVLPCDNCSSWQWLHTDRYEALKKRMEA